MQYVNPVKESVYVRTENVFWIERSRENVLHIIELEINFKFDVGEFIDIT